MKTRFFIPLIWCILVVGILLLYSLFDARYVEWFPRCPFYMLTKLYCPGCGSQRALSALLHGDFFQSIKYNFLAIIVLPFLLYAAVINGLNLLGKKKVPLHIFYAPAFSWAVLIMVMVFTLVRNIPVYPFNMLAP